MRISTKLCGRLFATALMIMAAQSMSATAFTNVYAKAQVAPDGAGEVYITSDDPAETLGSVAGPETEVMYTTGSDGDYTDSEGVSDYHTRYWAVIHVAPAEGYKFAGIVDKIRDDGAYEDADYFTGKDVIVNGVQTKDPLMKDTVNADNVYTININKAYTYQEITNSNNFSNAEEARNAARAESWPDDPTMVYVLFKKEGTTGINSVVAKAVDLNAPAYNVAGQRVDASYKGLIIRNGKKYLRK